jgi:hypothetical protein
MGLSTGAMLVQLENFQAAQESHIVQIVHWEGLLIQRIVPFVFLALHGNIRLVRVLLHLHNVSNVAKAK